MSSPEWKDTPFIGLSATPWARGMGLYWDVLLRPVTIPELQGVLTPFRVLAPPPPDLTGVHVNKGDYVTEELAERCDRPEIVGNVVATWKRHASDRRTLVLGVDCNHAKHLQERFVEAGIACEYCDGDTPMFEREDMFKRLESGETQIISNVRTLDTGLDLPFVSCIVDARPTKSRILYVQSVGRGITAREGKEDCLILDHAGNCLRFGTIDQTSSDALDDDDERKSAERQPEKAKLCPECHCVQVPGARECPECGHVLHAVGRGAFTSISAGT
jgi:DNA repair protein RadD